jgi:outer membrane protein assembly factor BamD (BamD/ComL family)
MAVLVILLGCASRPVNIPDTITPAELVQRGQEASDRNRYSQALQYYEAILARFPTNIDAICSAEYEIAFIHYKQRKYETAKEEFNALLDRYNGPDAELLPPQFKRLTGIVLERIAEKEPKRRKKDTP